MTTLFEVCCTTIESAQSALADGAHRVELCSNLESGGLTPIWLTRLRDDSTLRKNLQPRQHSMGQGVDFLNPTNLQNKTFLDRSHVLIRCRPGNFIYTQAEVDAMCASIRLCRQARVKGVVIGALTPDGHLDRPAIEQMIHAATGPTPDAATTTSLAPAPSSAPAPSAPSAPAPSAPASALALPALTLVFHRAFDRCTNPMELLEQIIELGFHTLLTSGQGETAEEGIPLLEQLVAQAKGRICIMAGRGVTRQNVARIIRETRVPAVHMSARPGLAQIAQEIGAVGALHIRCIAPRL
jgi:copper homeostasis protein